MNSAKETDANDENLDEDIVEEDYCEPVSMQEKQDRCMVSFSVTSVHYNFFLLPQFFQKINERICLISTQASKKWLNQRHYTMSNIP